MERADNWPDYSNDRGMFGTGVFGALKSGGFVDPNSESTKAENLLIRSSVVRQAM